jgi:FMN phosphatase YigB (HAD superfamily)
VTLTLLLDLDGTLLINKMNTFLPSYLQAISTHLAAFVEPNRLINTLLTATSQAAQNKLPECTLQNVFEGAFYPTIGIRPEELHDAIEHFYDDVFPSLKSLTQPQPGAVQLVEQAFERGYQVVIATNPLFPYKAIAHRLEWAGLSPAQYPFALIPSIETFHFAKPNPAFMAEILARLGWPEGPVVMVGDDPENDIQSAGQLGILTYWISNGKLFPVKDSLIPDEKGDIKGVLSWLDEKLTDPPQPDFNNPAALLAILRTTPAVLDSLCKMLDEDRWTTRPQSKEWCQAEIICHLRDVDEEVNLPRMRKVLQENNPFLPGRDTDPWADERKYICQDGSEALHKFITNRKRLLNLLENIQPEDWHRKARHAIFGPTELLELVNIIAGHDRLHIQQANQTLEAIAQKNL